MYILCFYCVSISVSYVCVVCVCVCCVCVYLFSPYSHGPPSIISPAFFLQLSTTTSAAHNTFTFTGTMLKDKASGQGKND
jgi:hypothetical protein